MFSQPTNKKENTPELWRHSKFRSRQWAVLIGTSLVLIPVFLLGIATGSVPIPLDQIVSILLGNEPEKASWGTIIDTIRIPRSITAVLAGSSLGLAGLQMQTLFRNPLADPFILGITAGASFGVAIIVLLETSTLFAFSEGLSSLRDVSTVLAAILGAGGVLALIMLISIRVRSYTTILIIGLMISYAVGSLVTVMIANADARQIELFVAWGFGSFRGVTWNELRIFAPVVGGGIILGVLLTKQLNALLLGEGYAQSMGLNVKRMRLIILLGSSVLAGVVTAFCGPIAFLGVAIPHVARVLLGTSDHRVLVPAVILLGSVAALIAELIAQLPGQDAVLPLNAITSLIGAPIVILILMKSRRRSFA